MTLSNVKKEETKKIMHINVTYKNTSTGSIIWDLTRPKSGYESIVLFQHGDNEDEIAQKYENKFQNILRRALNKLFGNKSSHARSGTKKIVRKIKKEKPDIIHLHTLHHGILDYEYLFKFLAQYNKPVVYTMHDCWLFTGGCYYYTELGCEQYKNGCVNCEKNGYNQLDCKRSQVEKNWRIKRKLLTDISNIYFVGVSEWLCGQVKDSYLAKKEIVCIPNGVNRTFFEADDISVSNSKNDVYTIIGVASHWSERKGLSRFFELAQRLEREKYRIILVGQKVPESIKIPEIITMYGPTKDAQELLQLYKQATVFVNMSYEETFGLVTVEAACAGLPVVAFDSTANTEVVNRVGGYLIQPGDMDIMIKTIENICENNLKNKTPIEEIHGFFSKERMVRQYMELYNEIIKNN